MCNKWHTLFTELLFTILGSSSSIPGTIVSGDLEVDWFIRATKATEVYQAQVIVYDRNAE
jgi:hypothetical protein